jgi:hypothetical protein
MPPFWIAITKGEEVTPGAPVERALRRRGSSEETQRL